MPRNSANTALQNAQRFISAIAVPDVSAALRTEASVIHYI